MAVGWRVRSLIQTADSLEPADRMVTHACDVHDVALSPQGGIPWRGAWHWIIAIPKVGTANSLCPDALYLT